MASGKGECKECGILIKLEPCNECPDGFDPAVCPRCHGEIEVELLPVKEN